MDRRVIGAKLGMASTILVLVVLGACSAGDPRGPGPARTPLPETRAERLERLDPDVYSEIRAITDCAELEAAHARAASSNEEFEVGHPSYGYTLGAMRAAEEQMAALGCTG